METVIFSIIILTALINAWFDASRIWDGKEENHEKDVLIRTIISAAVFWIMYNEFGSIWRAISFLFFTWSVWWIIFDVFMSLALYGQFFLTGTTSWVDRVTGKYHVHIKIAAIIISMAIYSRVSYVYF